MILDGPLGSPQIPYRYFIAIQQNGLTQKANNIKMAYLPTMYLLYLKSQSSKNLEEMVSIIY